MAFDNRVLWSEGLFLQPQHFQQHDRYLERLIGARSGIGIPHPWGVSRLRINEEMLALGKFALTEVAGILPDGTPFDAPASDPLPEPLELTEDLRTQHIYLALPLRQRGIPESAPVSDREAVVRYRGGELSVADNTCASAMEAAVEIGRLELRLMLEQQARDGSACCGLVNVLGCRADRQIVLDEDYIPPCVDVQVSRRLVAFLEELSALLHRQAERRASKVWSVGQGGIGDWVDLVMLQVLNRAEPVVAHLARLRGHHPETIYRFLLGLAGELATFASENKRPGAFPPYRHEDLDATFSPVIEQLRRYLNREYVERALLIPIEERQYGYRIARVEERALLDSARFVLAVHASLDARTLRDRFPSQVKVGPVARIREFVTLSLPGITLNPLSRVPLEIPYHDAAFEYFELDRGSDFWEGLSEGEGFGLHIGGEFPKLQLELWAIRD